MNQPVSQPDDADLGLLAPVWAGTAVARRTSDRALAQDLLDVERTWLQVCSTAGLVDLGAEGVGGRGDAGGDGADGAGGAAGAGSPWDASAYDLVSIAQRSAGGGNPLIPLLGDLRSALRAAGLDAASRGVHLGATSQDIIDTALMVMAHEVVELLLADLDRALAALATLAERHRDTPCIARSLGQHALPTTFGLRVAQWRAGLLAATHGLRRVGGSLPLQWGGAAGTLAGLELRTAPAGLDAFALSDDLAQRLGLAASLPWHTRRQTVTGLGFALADVVAAAGKIATDIAFATRPEVGELVEPSAPGRGGSSAMPHKRNPVLSIMIRSAALDAPAQVATLLTAAGLADHERPDGAWHAEWPSLRALLRLAGGVTPKLAELCSGLAVDETALRRNLEHSGAAVVTERIMAVVAPLVPATEGRTGKAAVQAAVDESLSGGTDLATALRALVPASALDDAALDDLLQPTRYLGLAPQLTDRLLSQENS